MHFSHNGGKAVQETMADLFKLNGRHLVSSRVEDRSTDIRAKVIEASTTGILRSLQIKKRRLLQDSLEGQTRLLSMHISLDSADVIPNEEAAPDLKRRPKILLNTWDTDGQLQRRVSCFTYTVSVRKNFYG